MLSETLLPLRGHEVKQSKIKFYLRKMKLSFVSQQDKLKFTYVLNVTHKMKLSYVIIQDNIKVCNTTR